MCSKARSGQAFIANSACKQTNLLLLHLINLNLGKLGCQKNILFCRKGFNSKDSYYKVSAYLLSILVLTIHMNRFHYQDYLSECMKKGIEPKAHPPMHFQSDDRFVFIICHLPGPQFFFFQDAGEDQLFCHCYQEITSYYKGWLEGIFARAHCGCRFSE